MGSELTKDSLKLVDPTSGNDRYVVVEGDTIKIKDQSGTVVLIAEAHGSRHASGGADEVTGIALFDTAANRPAAGTAGRFFLATDTWELSYDNGGSWDSIGVLGGLDLTSHASRHASGGADPLSAGGIAYSMLDTNTKRFTVGVRIAADAAAGDTWERAVLYAPVALTVIDAGIVPDTAFGQDTNYATIAVLNKGTDGTGVTSLVSLDFTAANAVSAYDYKSLGTIANASVSAGQVLSFKKTVGGTGQIVPASLLVLYLERAA